MSCNLCYHGAFWTRGRERLPSARMFADWLASVHMHEFKPSLVTMLPVSRKKISQPVRTPPMQALFGELYIYIYIVATPPSAGGVFPFPVP